MNTTRTWTLAAIVGLLGTGDWFLATLPADENAPPKPVLTVGNATVTAAVRDVDSGGKKEQHLFLDLKGQGAGTVKVRLSSTTINPMRRSMPRPRVEWEKEIALDSARLRSVDLGFFLQPGETTAIDRLITRTEVIRTLAASTDGKTYVTLLTTRPLEQKKSLPGINRTEM